MMGKVWHTFLGSFLVVILIPALIIVIAYLVSVVPLSGQIDVAKVEVGLHLSTMSEEVQSAVVCALRQATRNYGFHLAQIPQLTHPTRPWMLVADVSNTTSRRHPVWVVNLNTGSTMGPYQAYSSKPASGSCSLDDESGCAFSNLIGTKRASLGLYAVHHAIQSQTHCYQPGDGVKACRTMIILRGLDPGFNDRASERDLRIHPAWRAVHEKQRPPEAPLRYADNEDFFSEGCLAMESVDFAYVQDKIASNLKLPLFSTVLPGGLFFQYGTQSGAEQRSLRSAWSQQCGQ